MASGIYEVAEKAGVSISTVSRVLNGKDRVHPETRRRIRGVIEELDYQQSASARALATSKHETIGFVIPRVNDPFFSEIVRGVEAAASASGYGLLIASQPRSESRGYIQIFKRRFIDALIIAGIDVTEREVMDIAGRNIKVVLIQHELGENIPSFSADNYSGAVALAQHLLDHGRKRFAYIGGTNYTRDSSIRLQALRDTLGKAGLDIPENYIVHGDYLRDSGRIAMHKLLKLHPLPDAVLAANDQMAVDALQAVQEKNLRVPEDIALTGFDDIPLAGYLSPALTTVRQPTFEMGFQAARKVLEMITEAQCSQDTPDTQMVLPTELVIRQSCGCP